MATKKILVDYDFAKNHLNNVAFQVLASPPSSPVQGQFYYDSTQPGFGFYTGSGWVYPTASAGLANAYSSVTDGSATATASGGDTFRLRSANSALTVAVTNNDGTYGDNALFTFVASAVTRDTLGAPVADVSWNSHKITNLLDPTGAQDAATKNYVDSTVQGLQQKPTAIVATTGTLPANTYANGASGVGATLTGNSNGALAAVDGYTAVLNDIILVKNEATGANNGLYKLTQVGDGSHPYILTRHIDMDQTAEFRGAFVPVGNSGTTNANSLWLMGAVDGAFTVGTTSVTFTELNKATDLAAGSGINITGNSIAVSGYVGEATIVTVGTIATGIWNGTSVAILYGGTGATTAAGARANLGATGKYSALVGDGATNPITVTQGTHGLASDRTNLAVVTDATSGDEVDCRISYASNGSVTVEFNTVATSNQYRLTIIG